MKNLVLSLFFLFNFSVVTVDAENEYEYADLFLYNARIYTLDWPDPNGAGKSASLAPFKNGKWYPNANSIAIKGNKISAVGEYEELKKLIGSNTKKINLNKAIVIPGLVDGHTHIGELGENLDVISLHGSETPEAAIQRVNDALKKNPIAKGEWIIARGWDEGAWANKLPDAKLLDKHFPDNPVHMDGAYGFIGWGNSIAMRLAGIDRDTKAPVGGEIVKDKHGDPTGIVMNRGVMLYRNAIPKASIKKRKKQLLAALYKMSEAGYVMVHHAGVAPDVMAAYQQLADDEQLPIRVYAMISGRNKDQMKRWIKKGPYSHPGGYLYVRSVKGYYDGSLGARGAKLLQSYSDKSDHYGISGADYGFFTDEISEILQNGFQINIHAIGDAGNRDVLDFYEANFRKNPSMRHNRHRIEHAQVIHPDDFARYHKLSIIASAQPPFVAEDKRWATDRIGKKRAKGAFAWRSFRKNDVAMVFGSDLTSYDFDIFYGMHSIITRQDRSFDPPNGWEPQEKLTSEEALLGYTRWAAYSAFLENKMGQLKSGYWADIAVLDIDVLNIGNEKPNELLKGNVLMTVVNGKIIFSTF